jgi:ABC-type branched-subunit amino acid transport system ATPase component
MTPPALHLTDLSHRYGGLATLDNVVLELPPGARHAVIGPNGAGKSTLFHLIAGTRRPSTGRIHLHGHDTTHLGAAARARRGIGRTFQHPATCHRLSALANVALGVTHRSADRATAWWRRSDRTTQAHRILDECGLAEYADIPAGQLSYGQRRQLEVAVALAAKPALLLLDEPSAGLTPDEAIRLSAMIAALPRTVTVLLTDHHLDLIWSTADTVTVLDHGRQHATGSAADIRANQTVQTAYLGHRSSPPTIATSSSPAATLLRIRGLRAGYDGSEVLAGVDLDIPAGGFVALVGRNGSGKTTLLNAVAGLLPHPVSGEVLLEGRPLRAEPHRVGRLGVAIVPQGRRLFALTVAEHLAAAGAAAKHVATPGPRWTRHDLLAMFPPLAHRLRHPAPRLSGGEQQMLAIARALLANPRLLLLDEPLEGIAPVLAEQVTGAIKDAAARGVTVVWADHDKSRVKKATHFVVLEQGRAYRHTGSDQLQATVGPPGTPTSDTGDHNP